MSVVAPNLSTRSRIPSLQQGDRLSRQEFHRRYVASPHIKKAELIEGIVHMASPVSCQHASPHAQLNTILGMYSGRTPGVEVLDNATVRLDDYNEVQPDILLRVAGSRKDGGAGNTYVEGAPELVVEIAASSVNVDLHDKLEAYRRNGVQEYVVWRVEDGCMDWFVLVDGQYTQLDAPAGVFHSQVFPGLWVNAKALLLDELGAAMDTLNAGIATAEHAEFAHSLA